MRGLLSLSPLLVFLLLYLLTSMFSGDFYKIPISAVFLLSCIYGILTCRPASPGKPRISLAQRIEVFTRGTGNGNIQLMIAIFILAGAFAQTAKDLGAIDATVSAALCLIPPKALYAGLFFTSCFISMAVGTSMGTIVALVPIASGIATQSGLDTAYLTANVVGGSLFGDNLSFISDTTIAATRAVGAKMRDKFHTNIRIVLPAVLVVTGIYLYNGWHIELPSTFKQPEWLMLAPYILVIILAFTGLNVILLLCIGLATCAIIGFGTGVFVWSGWLCSIGNGIASMSDLIIVTFLSGGLMEIIRFGGGLDYLVRNVSRGTTGKKGAQLSIAILVCLTNLCTANNTITIITTGDIARQITQRFHLDPRRTASILDTFSCFIQGIIPYGAQLLMASTLSGITPMAIIPYLYYPFCMGICALLYIFLHRE